MCSGGQSKNSVPVSDDSGSKNCTSELLALPRDSPSSVDDGDAPSKPDSGACCSCGVEPVVSINLVYSHSSIGEPGDSRSKSKYESAVSVVMVEPSRGCRSVIGFAFAVTLLLLPLLVIQAVSDESTVSVFGFSSWKRLKVI